LTEEQRAYTKTILSSGETLMNIIEDILDFSKIEADRLELDPVPVNMLELADDVCALYTSKARDKALELAVHYAPGSEQFVYADPVRVRQIVGNLINNAIKFTEKGYVVLTVREDPSAALPDDRISLVFTVEDTGIGVPPEAQDRIFDKFTQADASTTRDFGGTGLGLSICKRLIEMMGGRIALASRVGHGSVFTFNLILRRNRAEVTAPVRPPALRDVKVLIVDDLAVIRTLVSEQLTIAGMRCVTAENAEEALHMIRQAAAIRDPYDIAIIDYLLPGMNGEMLARAIAGEKAAGDTCLVMLTAAGNTAVRENFMERGFSAYISKPVRARQLIDTLAVVWSKYRSGQTDTLIRVDPGALSSGQGAEKEPRLDGARILLAEDSRINQAFAEDVLKQIGCEVAIVANGREAVEAVLREEFDLVLMDCQMPVMDGFEAARRIRALKDEGALSADLPVIALTANAMKGDRQKCLDAGMNDYLSKPVRTRDLKEKVYFTITRRKGLFRDDESGDPGQGMEPDAEAAPEPPAAPEPGLIDAAAMAEARRILRDRYGEMIDCYIEDVSGYLDEIRAALASGQVERALRPAHTIKSASRRMGAVGLSRTAEGFEAAMRAGPDEARLQEMAAELSALFDTTRRFLLTDRDRRGRA
jgi:CheY-like chemotaxis protein